MDILEIVRTQVGSLPEGQHEIGLRSVLRHIEAAYRHLSRGQKDSDDSAFSDAIYRSNQAFEGSIKEAYRVLAEKDPHKTTPYNIEQYLQKNNLFRPRVLSQFTNYRTEWRNPATHDYNLDFDEDEAFLAIVSVTAFSKMLVDQISEKLAFVAVRDDVTNQQNRTKQTSYKHGELLEDTTKLFSNFLQSYAPSMSSISLQTETQLLGSLSGYITSVGKDITVQTNHLTKENGRLLEIDMLVSRGDESIVIELKGGHQRKEPGLRHLEMALMRLGLKSGILLNYTTGICDYAVEDYHLPGGVELKIISPANDTVLTPSSG